MSGAARLRARAPALLAFVLAPALASAQSIPSDVLDAARRSSASAADAGSPVPRPVATLEGAVDPAAYVLGPGDLLEIAYTGRANPVERVRVSPSGRIHLAPTGPVEVAGLTLAEAEAKLRELLGRYYSQTRIGLDLIEIRSFRVHVLGEVERPGAREVTAAERVSDLFPAVEAREPADAAPLRPALRASERNLVLRRTSGGEIPVDLVRYRRLGDLAANPFLEDGDILFVPPKRDSVSVFGWVPRPGFIEFRAGDAIDDLVSIAGGFDSGADRGNVELRRFEGSGPEEAVRRILNFEAGDGRVPAAPGDGVYIRADLEWRKERLVEIHGEVRFPGVFAIQEGTETLRTLIDRAGGFTPEADPQGTLVERPDVFDRPAEDPEFQRLQNIPIAEMSHEEYEYLKLRSRQRAGLASAMLSVNLGRGGDVEGEDLVLRSGDRVRVPKKNLAVDVQGAVKNPGFVPFDPARRAKDYLDLAGGISAKARTGGARIIRHRTGEWVKADGDTPVDAGDTVWIPEKQDRDWWKITREGVSFLAAVATIVVVINNVNN